MKIVKESLLEFHQTGDPLGSLDLGSYEAYINVFFDELGVSRDDYRVVGKETVFNTGLNLEDRKSLSELPENLSINGYLHLKGCSSLIKLPKVLNIRNDLILIGCISLIELPRGLNLNGDLSLSKCISLTKLPNDLRVKGYLYLYDCTNLKELPNDLTVGGYIWVKSNQEELIEYIKQSKYEDYLRIQYI
jgi:hypothetical protein